MRLQGGRAETGRVDFRSLEGPLGHEPLGVVTGGAASLPCGFRFLQVGAVP